MDTVKAYEVFHPPSDWIINPRHDNLVVDLPDGFKMEHLSIHLDNFANVKIRGERHVDGKKWSRFEEEFPIPEDPNKRWSHSPEMITKLENGQLHVILPKTKTWVDDTDHKQPTPIKEFQITGKPRATPISIEDRSSVNDKKTTSTADVASDDKQMKSVKDSSIVIDKKTASTAAATADKQTDRSSVTVKKSTSTTVASADKQTDRSSVSDKKTTSTAAASANQQTERSSVTDKETNSTDAAASADKQMDFFKGRSSVTDKKTTLTADAAADKQTNSIKDRSSVTDKKTTSTTDAAANKQTDRSSVTDKQTDSIKDSSSGADKKTTLTGDVSHDKPMKSVKDSNHGRTSSEDATSGDTKMDSSSDVANATVDGGLVEETYTQGGLVLVFDHTRQLIFDQTRQLMMNVLVAFLVLMALAIYVSNKLRSPT